MARVLWLSPWLRPLARVHAEALTALGHEVLLVTSDQHPESDAARPYELVLTPSPKDPSSWAPFVAGWRTARAFGADVAVVELVRDPRWIALAAGVPRVEVVHDDRPHGAEEVRPRWERALFDRYGRGAARTVAFSEYVAGALRTRGVGADVLPLPSDVADSAVPMPVPGPAERRDFVVFGRLNPYKNVPVTLAAWRRHVDGPGWRGDELVLVGDGDVPGPLPPHTRWQRGRFRYADVLPLLARAKAAPAHYRQATQSGVQVLAQQLGVVPIVSPAGALPEFQPPGEDPVGVDDVAGLAVRFDELADPAAAARRGEAARAHYRQHFAAEVAARRWDALLADVTRAGARPARSSA